MAPDLGTLIEEQGFESLVELLRLTDDELAFVTDDDFAGVRMKGEDRQQLIERLREHLTVCQRCQLEESQNVWLTQYIERVMKSQNTRSECVLGPQATRVQGHIHLTSH